MWQIKKSKAMGDGKFYPFNNSVVSEDEHGCWVWQRPLNHYGYGYVAVNSIDKYAHRFSYEKNKGPIPEGLEIDHLCKNRACVNPQHLEAVTHEENLRRAWFKRAGCPYGHPYEGENVYIIKSGATICRTCKNERGREWSRKRAALKREKTNARHGE